MRKSFLLILFALLSFSTIYSSVSVTTMGVSPRDAAVSTTDIFNLAYNGLTNVGIGTQMYFKAKSTAALSGAQTWSVTKPNGSIATFGTKEAFDSTAEAIVFKPDLKGTYVITFTDGASSSSVTINAGTYLGTTDPACSLCHSGKAKEWNGTGHATALTRGLNGLKGDHFGPNCVSCHATGYDANADNNGFDDFTFVFPDTLFVGQADLLATAYPDAMKRANIQCESCHGPGSEHIGNKADSRIVSVMDSKVCAVCHDSGTHHVYPAQYDISAHATGTHQYSQSDPSRDRSECMKCHNGAGFIAFVNGEPQTEVEKIKITCATCHDPHSNANENHQLRTTADVILPNGEVITEGGYGKLCMTCHNGRRIPADRIAGTSPTPHAAPQAEMISGKNVPTFGFDLPSSPHLQIENSCVTCHMGEAQIDATLNIPLAGGHSFNVNLPDGTSNVATCAPCHGDVGATFADKKYYFNGNADHDGDGVAEGLQVEVEGMLEELALLIHPVGEPTINTRDVNHPMGITEKTAVYNYTLVEEDKSFGIHNPAFTVALLKVSMEALKYGEITSGEMVSVSDIPMDQGKQVRVVWTAFGADNGIGNDKVESYTIVRKVDGSDNSWDAVATIPAIQYIEYSAVVPTLKNSIEGDTVWTAYKVIAKTKNGIQAETTPMSGFSVDNLVPTVPGNVAIAFNDMSAVLTWDKPVDADFNYFEVFRSETQGFVPSIENMVTTTVENNFSDSQIEIGKTYFYKVAARDLSKNQSALSAEVNLTITGINDLGNVPVEYSLNQNYPNPFNPSTTIKFGIPETSDVQITIYDMVGNKVEVLVNENLSAGYHTYNWNASNRASGIYFLQMTTSKFTKVNKMLLVK